MYLYELEQYCSRVRIFHIYIPTSQEFFLMHQSSVHDPSPLQSVFTFSFQTWESHPLLECFIKTYTFRIAKKHTTTAANSHGRRIRRPLQKWGEQGKLQRRSVPGTTALLVCWPSDVHGASSFRRYGPSDSKTLSNIKERCVLHIKCIA